jgi:hydrogenase/urease accessory protein HupE
MGSLHSNLIARSALPRVGMAALGWAWATAALAHPGHDHDSWLAQLVHLFSGPAPLLLVLAVGASLSLLFNRKGREDA